MKAEKRKYLRRLFSHHDHTKTLDKKQKINTSIARCTCTFTSPGLTLLLTTMDNNHNNMCTGRGSDGNNVGVAHNNSNANKNAAETFAFRSHDDFQNNDPQNPSNSSAALVGQTFRVKTGEPTSRDSSTGGLFAVGTGIARPNSAPVPQSFDETYMGSVEQQNFDFQTFKAKIQGGSFNQVRDELASFSNTLDNSESGFQEPYFKSTSGGRKKRANSDPMGGEGFFDAFPFDDVEDGNGKRGRQKEVHDRSKGPFKRSRSVDAVDHMANMAASLFPGFENDSDSEASAFDFKQDIEPIEVPLKTKPKRRSSEPMINPTFWDDSNLDFPGPDQMAQDLVNVNFSQLMKPGSSEGKLVKSSSRKRSNSEPMFSDDFANAFGEGGGGGKDNNPNVDLFDSIQDVLGLDGSDRSFDNDQDEKPSASTAFKQNNPAPMLSAEFFDTMFDEFNKGAARQNGNQAQDDVAQDELDMFVNRMFQPEPPNQFTTSRGGHQRSMSLDALASFQTVADRINGNTQNSQLIHTPHQNNSTQEESLRLFNMLFAGDNNIAGQSSANSCFNLPQTMDNTNMNFLRQNLMNSNHAASDNCDDATAFVINAIKATQNQLQTLHPLVIKSGNVSAVEEMARAFKTAALASQHILASDLPNAVAVLSQAQSSIEVIWAKISGSLVGGQRSHGNNVVFGTDILANGAQPMNITSNQRDSDSVCSSVTGASLHSRSNTPDKRNLSQQVKSSDFDAQSVMSTCSKRSQRSSGSGRSSSSRRSKCPDLNDLPPQDTSNPDVIMARLKGLMQRTQYSQKKLQNWDKKNGLPKSHSQTMVNSSRSRKQLQEGVVLKKWNGVPLIGTEKK